MFAQQHYSQRLGNGSYSISDAGCFLTAICNGLERFNGSAPDPVTLNQFYLSHGLFLPAGNGALEDLSWHSISQFDPSIIVSQIGNGALPSDNHAIVKFHYNSVHSGQPIDHFCWVDHIEGDQVFIVDSWDGQVKGPSGYQGVYHLPIAWATYTKQVAPQPTCTYEDVAPYDMLTAHQPTHWWNLNNDSPDINNFHVAAELAADTPFRVGGHAHNRHFPQYTYAMSPEDFARAKAGDFSTNNGVNLADLKPVPVPPPRPPDAPLPIPRAQKHTLNNKVAAYNTATDAGNHTNQHGSMPAGDYFVFNTYPDKPNLLNLTLINAKPGAWVNTDEDVEIKGPGKTLTDEEKQAIKDDWAKAHEPPAPEVIEVVVKPTPATDTENTVRMSIHWFLPDHSPIECEVIRPVMATEVFNKRPPIQLAKNKNKEYSVYGTFIKDGRCYALFRLGNDHNFDNLIGVPVKSHEDLGPYLNDIYSVADKIRYGFERAWHDATQTIEGIFKPKHKK